MILLLGANTYVGQGFARALQRRKDSFVPLSRSAFDYTRFDSLFDYVRKMKPDLVINAAEIQDKLTHDLDDSERAEMLQVNTLLPQTIARVCNITNTLFAHVSSGSIYCGAKVAEDGGFRVEEDLSAPRARAWIRENPDRLRGFTELDPPNFGFASGACTFYSGTKALAEEALRDHQLYVWRLHLPFNEVEDASNFLSHLRDASVVRKSLNSVSQLDDCITGCLELWERNAPVGTYNVVNPGPLQMDEVTEIIRRSLKSSRSLKLLLYDADSVPPNQHTALDCVLDGSKLFAAGIRLRPAQEALRQAVFKWVPQSTPELKSLA